MGERGPVGTRAEVAGDGHVGNLGEVTSGIVGGHELESAASDAASLLRRKVGRSESDEVRARTSSVVPESGAGEPAAGAVGDDDRSSSSGAGGGSFDSGAGTGDVPTVRGACGSGGGRVEGGRQEPGSDASPLGPADGEHRDVGETAEGERRHEAGGRGLVHWSSVINGVVAEARQDQDWRPGKGGGKGGGKGEGRREDGKENEEEDRGVEEGERHTRGSRGLFFQLREKLESVSFCKRTRKKKKSTPRHQQELQ